MPLIFEHLASPTPEELAQIDTLFKTNFEPVMQKPFRILVDGCQDGSIWVLVARNADRPGEILGAATLVSIPQAQMIYLCYLAVDQYQHNQGTGSQFFNFMVEFVTQRFEDANTIVWDVEVPDPDDPAHIDNRRIRFYERLGAQMLPLSDVYRMPLSPPDEPGGATFPLRLMWLPVHGRTTPPDKTEVAAWITAIHLKFYPEHQALLDQMLAELGETA